MFAIKTEVRYEVDRITSNDKFLKNISSKINPYMIFDEDGRYLVDGGAFRYIEDIEIKKYTVLDKTKAPSEIILHVNQILAYPPQLKCIDFGSGYSIHVEQGEKNTWIYELQQYMGEGGEWTNKFRIDIIP